MRQVLGFSTLASHELRTPLTVVRNELEEALQEGTPQEALQTTLASTYDEILRLSRIVEDLLSLSTMQAGTFRLQLATTDLCSFLSDFCDEALIICQEKRIAVARDFPHGIVAELDPDRFRYVLFNLLDNAVKHTPEEGTITVSARSEGGWIIIGFADTGTGIPEDHLPNIFDPFRSAGTDPARTPGTGLGLALVQWIVEAHGGTVCVEQSNTRGTKFSISIPVAQRSDSTRSAS
jgi:two-component system sensor histidine kinase ResE